MSFGSKMFMYECQWKYDVFLKSSIIQKKIFKNTFIKSFIKGKETLKSKN